MTQNLALPFLLLLRHTTNQSTSQDKVDRLICSQCMEVCLETFQPRKMSPKKMDRIRRLRRRETTRITSHPKQQQQQQQAVNSRWVVPWMHPRMDPQRNQRQCPPLFPWQLVEGTLRLSPRSRRKLEWWTTSPPPRCRRRHYRRRNHCSFHYCPTRTLSFLLRGSKP